MQVSENIGNGKYPKCSCPKHKVRKINYFGEKQGVSENIGCPKNQSIYSSYDTSKCYNDTKSENNKQQINTTHMIYW